MTCLNATMLIEEMNMTLQMECMTAMAFLDKCFMSHPFRKYAFWAFGILIFVIKLQKTCNRP